VLPFIFALPYIRILMADYYLLKTEPSEYSFADLERDKATLWDGVTSPAGVKHLREMKAGAELVIYETANRKCTVGTATVIAVDASDPKNPKVKIHAGKPLLKTTTLAEIKANKVFAGSPLIREGRLSVVPLSAAQYHVLVGD
jgi:predicted RNA-binding protein with PUA-like domain